MTVLPHGWLSDIEAHELHRLAKDKTVLEMGAWKGRSTFVLSQVASYVVSVDRHQGIVEMGDEDSLPDYLANIRGLPNVAIVVADFEQIVPFLADFEMVFVDGSHDEQSAFRDATMAVHHAADGGTLAFHDWDMPSVRDGVTSSLRRDPDRVRDSLAVYTLA